jgi:hypothetical protein
MVLVMLFALVGALLAGVRTDRCEFSMITRVSRHESRVECRQVCNIPTETNAPCHPFAVISARIRAPFTGLRGVEAIINALGHLVGEVVDLGERHTSINSTSLALPISVSILKKERVKSQK